MCLCGSTWDNSAGGERAGKSLFGNFSSICSLWRIIPQVHLMFLPVLFNNSFIQHTKKKKGSIICCELLRCMLENWRTRKLIVPSQGEKDVSLHFLLNSESLMKPPERQEQELEKRKVFPCYSLRSCFYFCFSSKHFMHRVQKSPKTQLGENICISQMLKLMCYK